MQIPSPPISIVLNPKQIFELSRRKTQKFVHDLLQPTRSKKYANTRLAHKLSPSWKKSFTAATWTEFSHEESFFQDKIYTKEKVRLLW